ncbi:protein FAM13B-like [Centruroides sculpturatus]|uniref:protein FAM13B-like n=1 Tax=Centruroides sculpturatus TaxID=218467 RepID=UPI000C6D63E3|nr:protein FAM13B-like [Centruroides sculpturatus]
MTMRKPSVCASTETVDMMTSNQPNNDSGESRIERMRKFLSSPLTRKRSPVNHTNSKVFGTPLEILIQKNSSDTPVPYIIMRICQYIEKKGCASNGLFRISGNARLIERLKLSFDQTGDAPLETEGDVASAAALLKLFLRELPDPLIPASMHQAFLSAAKTNGQSKEECIKQLKNLVQRLPLANLNVLKYLSCFLVSVSHHEEENRMNASALGIVFGPNLFRVAEDFKGLKEQSLTNQIVTYFISDYHNIFNGELEYSGTRVDTLGDEERLISLNNNACLGLPSSTLATQKTSLYPSIGHATDLESLSVVIPSVDNALLMIHPDKELLPERQPPFLMVNSLVEETINRTITEHLFGEDKGSVEESNGAIQFRRKRKDRKLLSKEHQNSHEIPGRNAHSQEILSFAHCSEASTRTDAYSVDDINGFQSSDKYEHNHQNSKKLVTDDHSISLDIHRDSKIHSPRPPKPKRREIETLSNSEPVLDPQAVLSSGDFSFHEAQRIVERLTPRSSVRSQLLVSKSTYQKNVPFISDKYENQNKEKVDALTDNNLTTTNQQSTDIPSEITELKNYNDDISIQTSSNARDSFETEQSTLSMEESFVKVSPSDLSEQFDLSNSLEEFSTGHDAMLPNSDDITEEKSDLIERKFGYHSDIMRDSYSSECASDNNDLEQLSSEHRFSWPILKNASSEDATLSPCPNHLRKTNSFEASLSPSAYKSYLSHRSEHLDQSLPPSPPVEQEDFIKSSSKDDETVTLSIKFLTKKIHGLKKKIKQFDEAYEATHGYRPSHAEKMNYPDMKKIITELNKIRKELKHLKEEGDVMEMSVESPVSYYAEPCVCTELPNSKSTTTVKVAENHGVINRDGRKRHSIEDSLKDTLKSLSDKRQLAERPEELEAMTKEQVVEEKVAIQKALLRFESVHGRPVSKTDRDLMRPLYDRYRNVKRIISKSGYQSSGTSKVKDSLAELQPILEHVAMDFKTPEHKRENETSPTVVAESSQSSSEVTTEQTVPLLEKSTEKPPENNVKLRNIPTEVQQYGSNLHELPLPELIRRQQYAKIEKHRLRRLLRDFEEQFQKQTGRKLQKEDRIPMESIYGEYKHVKAQLKLLEALLSKHEQHLI